MNELINIKNVNFEVEIDRQSGALRHIFCPDDGEFYDKNYDTRANDQDWILYFLKSCL